jgi:hypothetical protein
VVHLSLTEVSSTSPEKLEENLLRLLRHRASVDGHTLDSVDTVQALPELLRLLHAGSGRQVVVIVDEYEKPVHDRLGDPVAARAMRDVLAAFYGSLKGCDADLEKLFITGIGRMVRTSVFSSLNQMQDLTLARSAAEICGYTEKELRSSFAPFMARLAKANRVTQRQAWSILRDRYNGYWWGEGARVYNPWSILNCMETGKFANYWWASGTPSVMLATAGTLQLPEGDLDGVESSDLGLLFDIGHPQPVPFLWQSGYLTIQTADAGAYTLGFPNGEVRESWYAMMLDRFTGGRGPHGSTTAVTLLAALRNNDRPRFERALTALFAAIPSELHVDREAYYHSIFHAVMEAVGAHIIAESHTDKGRADAVIQTANTIYILELKLGTAEAALAQINARRYYEPYLADPRAIVLLGVGGFEDRAIRCLWEVLEDRNVSQGDAPQA